MPFNMILATLAVVGGIACTHLIGVNLMGKRWNDIEHVLVSSVCTTFNVYCFYSKFDHNILLSQRPPGSLLLFQTAVMLGYYIAFGIIELIHRTSKSRNDLMMAHHVLAATTIAYAHVIDVHQCTCAFLMLFTVSNPPLAIAKAQHRAGGDGAGGTAFVIFAIMFVIFRVCLVPCLIWVMMTDGWDIAMSTG